MCSRDYESFSTEIKLKKKVSKFLWHLNRLHKLFEFCYLKKKITNFVISQKMVSVRKFFCWDLYTATVIIGWVSLAASCIELISSYLLVDNIYIMLPGKENYPVRFSEWYKIPDSYIFRVSQLVIFFRHRNLFFSNMI